MAQLLGAIGVIASVMYFAYQINGDREAFGLSGEGAIRISGFNLGVWWPHARMFFSSSFVDEVDSIIRGER